MNSRLMREFEEFEGLGGLGMDELVIEEKDDSDDMEKPKQAKDMSANDIYSELEKRGLKTTGFPDTDRELLQKALNEEFYANFEEMRAKKREKLRKQAQQLGLQKRRMMMERTLQEEQDELARNHQIGMMIELVKENSIGDSLRINVNSVSARSLAKAMWVNDTITCLDLSSNELNDHAGTYLARILKRNSTLKKLELDNNNLGPKACQAFGEALQHNTSITYLSFDSNPIVSENGDNSGLKALTEAVKHNRVITSLNLWRTGIKEAGGKLLAAALEENPNILFCDIGHNAISIGDVKRITDKLDENLSQYERNERYRRQREEVEGAKRKQEEDQREGERKRVELSEWLRERREQRSEDKRVGEEDRIKRMQEELEERKRQAEQQKEADRKAAEEAAEKKKKKDKKKK